MRNDADAPCAARHARGARSTLPAQIGHQQRRIEPMATRILLALLR